MSLPPGYSVRPATRGDAEEITSMFIEQELLLNGEAESTVEDLYDDWALPNFDMERDSWTVWHDNELAGYSAIAKQVPPNIYTAYGGVRPSHWNRGIGTFLFEIVEQRTAEIAGGPALVRQWIDTQDRAATEIVRRRGYGFVRRFWRMDVSLEDELQPPLDVEGVAIRPFERGRDERPAHDALEAAFTEHWGYSPRTFEQAAVSRWDAEWFRADLSLIAEVGGEVVGVCINGVRLDDGYVEDLGVLDRWRGRGIAEALLRRSFELFRDLGLKRASLNVDSDNSTGAMRLYERVGMTTGTCYDVFERALLC